MYHLRNAADIRKTDTNKNRSTDATHSHAQSVASSGRTSRTSARLVKPSTATPFVSIEANVEYARRVERARYESRRQAGDITPKNFGMKHKMLRSARFAPKLRLQPHRGKSE